MDRTYFIRRLVKNKIKKEAVTGEEISAHFAAQDEGEDGWVITHLPSGHRLVRCGFALFRDAKELALGVEKVLDSVLDSKSGDIYARNKEQDRMINFLKRLSEEYCDQVITMNEVKRLVGTL